MCGIAGIYNFNQDQEVKSEDISRMTDAIKHRGPDNSGVFLNRNVGLGYRRLSIIDTVEQEQPILANEDQTLRISFNGEIYNFPTLKEELLSMGHRFYTGTDTEMVLHLYEEEGEKCVEKLNGIFAFAILNTQDNSLFLARDQIGIKPLYYIHQESRFAFASEIKALLSSPGFKRKVSLSSLGHYFKYRFVPDPETMFDGVYKLRPGHWMKVDQNRVEIQSYFDLSSKFKTLDSEVSTKATAIGSIRSALTESVERQLIADVPLGAFLSGGIDSSIVVGLMAKAMGEPVKTFSIAFSESEFDESKYARQISKLNQTDHAEIILRPEHVKKLDEIVYHLDEPLADPAAVPTYFLSELAAQEVKVVLTGEGGDELFAGYKEDFNYRLGSALKLMPKSARIALAEVWSDIPDQPGKTRIHRSLLPEKERAEHILQDVFRFEEPPILADGKREDFDENKRYAFDYYWQKAQSLDWLSKLLYLETQIWLPGDPLMKVDKTTMAHGLEARVPILDLTMVELATQIPSRLKNKNGVEKYLLRKAFHDLLPDEIFNRPKTAFELPVAEWLRNELKPMVNEFLSDDKLNDSEFLDQKQVSRLIQSHMNGKKDYKYELWALLVFQMWYENSIK